ncbi:MAG: response regulator [Flaviaesturariibacter sp.]|nr:response regulator [Flaviaesturariibacter sp.]
MTADKKVLIIDDDSRNIFALKAVLKAKGYSIVSATEAREGINILLADATIKVVLMDMMMPDIDGYEAISMIRNNSAIAGSIIIAVTAQAMVGDKEKCLAAGANDYVSKPVDIDALSGLLNRYLN